MFKRISFILGLALILGFGTAASADTLGEHHNFFVNPAYDANGRTSAPATLEYISANAYFYVEDSYLNSLSPSGRSTLDQRLIGAGQDFDTTIYPRETVLWGSEANPGIDNDPRITILLERLSPGTGGYFDSVNDYPPSQAINTNQREMIVANVLSLGSDHLKIFLAHEIQHLISFNQKELLRNVSEEVWLNELRSQYAITAAGYNDDFANSDLYQRELTFLQNPNDSLTEWPNTVVDYSSVTLFGHYLVDQFGTGILFETLHSSLTGIASINKYLGDHGYSERFGDVFGDWVWADYINSRARNPRFGYANPGLQSIHAPVTANTTLSAAVPNNLTYSLKPWQPNWYQFFGDPGAGAKNIRISWHNPSVQVFYSDANVDARPLRDGDVIAPAVGSTFILMPVNEYKIDNFGTSEVSTPVTFTIEYTDQPTNAAAALTAASLHDGALIMHAGTQDIYVIWGTYKRYLAPDVLKFYGLDPAKAIAVPEATFQSYMPSNYIRAVNEKKVYAVWPDGTKHWLNMTARHFTESNRDWNSIFIVNNLESKFYRIGSDITQ